MEKINENDDKRVEIEISEYVEQMFRKYWKMELRNIKIPDSPKQAIYNYASFITKDNLMIISTLCRFFVYDCLFLAILKINYYSIVISSVCALFNFLNTLRIYIKHRKLDIFEENVDEHLNNIAKNITKEFGKKVICDFIDNDDLFLNITKEKFEKDNNENL